MCICFEMENFYELMRFKNINNSEIFSLVRSEYKRYKKIIDDQGLIGTISNITELSSRKNNTESEDAKESEESQRLARNG